MKCRKCGAEMDLYEKDTSSGRDMRTYVCRQCKEYVDVDNGVALWQVLHDAQEKDQRKIKSESVRGVCGDGEWALMGRVLVVGWFALVASASAALADAIDGQWCLGSSHFEINGPNIRPPGGNEIVGNYDRHGFTYVVPTNEEAAGTQIVMVLLNEESVRLTRGSSAPETWKRCKPIS